MPASHAPRSARLRTVLGPVLVVISCLSVQSSAAISSLLFDTLSTPAVAGLRQLTAAAVLLALVRPRVRGWGRRGWTGIAVYGATMAGMNVSFYSAVDLLPLGVAATLLFLGPFTVAVSSVRSRMDALFPAAGLAGVVLVSQPGGNLAWTGVAWGTASALALATYTVFAQRVGQTSTGLDGLSLSVGISALLLLPYSAPAAADLQGPEWLIVGVSGTVGVALAFTLDFIAVKISGARVVATLFALDPAIGALVGVIALDESLSVPVAAGIGLIVAAGAGVTWRTGGQTSTPSRPKDT